MPYLFNDHILIFYNTPIFQSGIVIEMFPVAIGCFFITNATVDTCIDTIM